MRKEVKRGGKQLLEEAREGFTNAPEMKEGLSEFVLIL